MNSSGEYGSCRYPSNGEIIVRVFCIVDNIERSISGVLCTEKDFYDLPLDAEFKFGQKLYYKLRWREWRRSLLKSITRCFSVTTNSKRTP